MHTQSELSVCLPPKGIMRPYPAKNKYEAESVDSKDRPEAASFSRAEGASASSTTRCHTPPRRDTGLRTTARGCIDWVPVATAEHFTSRDCALLRHKKGVQHIDSFLVTGPALVHHVKNKDTCRATRLLLIYFNHGDRGLGANSSLLWPNHRRGDEALSRKRRPRQPPTSQKQSSNFAVAEPRRCS